MLLEERMLAFLKRRQANQSFRTIQNKEHLIDFSSNDYLSFTQLPDLKERMTEQFSELALGATGSRLLTGHYELLDILEAKIAHFHQGEAALVFNAGYSANLSILSALPRRSDVILYDDLAHASIHDGIRLSAAHSQPFPHNDCAALQQLLNEHKGKTIFVVVESIYSMDGDAAPLKTIVDLCQQYQAHLIVDEAHSTGIYGAQGEGLCVELGIAEAVFARIYTFGKAMGGHGAAVVGSQVLKDYLINYARPLIYTTALPPQTVYHILETYHLLEEKGTIYIQALKERIAYFRQQLKPWIHQNYIDSNSPIQSILVPGNEAVLQLSHFLEEKGYDVRPIRTPTVPSKKERIRICLHCHNSLEQIQALVQDLQLGLSSL